MSDSTVMGLGTAVAGAGLALYGGYKYVTASETKEKMIASACVVAGLANVALGVGIMYFATTEKTECPINQLNTLLDEAGRETLTGSIFKAVNDTQGISCDNYLSWDDKYLNDKIDADGIQAIDGMRLMIYKNPLCGELIVLTVLM